MFHKIVSNLPFHPALLDEVGFYIKRLKQEDSIRRTGLILTALVFAVQIFFIISPSKPSLANSSNDLIYGAKSKEMVLEAYNTNRDGLGRTDIKAIFDHYGIGAIQISAAEPEKIRSLEKSFISTGRGTSPGIDTFIPIKNVADGGIYQRPLTNWDINGESWYNTITGMSSFGFRFWIIIDGCGNIVFEENSLKPTLEIDKKLSSGSINGSGEVVYEIEFHNSGPGNAKNVKIVDELDPNFVFVSYTSNLDLTFTKSSQTLSWKIANSGSVLPPSERWYKITLVLKTVELKSSKVICNSAILYAEGQNPSSSDPSCVNIDIPTCPGTGLPIPAGGISECTLTCPDGSIVPYNQSCKDPQLSCQSLKIIGEPSWDSRKFETTFVSQPGAIAKQIDYYVDNKKVSSVPTIDGLKNQLFTYKFKDAGQYTVKAKLIAEVGEVQPSSGCTIKTTITKPMQPRPRINTDKSVENLTQNIVDANGTTAKPGDKLKYMIIINNSGDATYDNLMLEGEYGESINDILEYGTLIDKEDATFNPTTNSLSWPAVSIKPGQVITKSFTVQVKNPLPNTPTSASDPLSYDFTLQNRYGRLVVIHLDKPVTKIVEQTAKTLPNTGPGLSIGLSGVTIALVSFFYYRGRLMEKELSVAYRAFTAGGL